MSPARLGRNEPTNVLTKKIRSTAPKGGRVPGDSAQSSTIQR